MAGERGSERARGEGQQRERERGRDGKLVCTVRREGDYCSALH